MKQDGVDITTLREHAPHAQYEVVDVVFGSAYTDVEVRHKLQPPTPEHVDYVVLRQSQAGAIYHDVSVTRKAWQDGIIYLRSNIAGARATLLLSVGYDKRVLDKVNPTSVTPAVLSHTHSAADITADTLARARMPAEVAYEDEANTFSGINSFTLGLRERSRGYYLGEGQSYAVVWGNTGATQPAVNNGALTGLYWKVGKKVDVTVALTIGSTTTLGTAGGLFTFSTPTTMASFGDVGSGIAFATGVPYIGITLANATGTFVLYANDGAGGVAILQNGAPFTFAAGDAMKFSFSYEEA